MIITPFRANDLTLHVILFNAQYHTIDSECFCGIVKCQHSAGFKQDTKYVQMFVTVYFLGYKMLQVRRLQVSINMQPADPL